jgi:hypothetical protein
VVTYLCHTYSRTIVHAYYVLVFAS